MKRNAGSFSTAYRTNLKLLPTLSMAFSFIDVLVQRLLGGFLWILRHRQDKALDQRSLVHGRSVLAEGMEGVFWVLFPMYQMSVVMNGLMKLSKNKRVFVRNKNLRKNTRKKYPRKSEMMYGINTLG